ncbi:MAG: hypothetical protein V7677_06850, partial [Motiliproteus sp.]
GYLIQASAVDEDTAQELFIEQTILFSADGYYIFQALVAADRKELFLEDFGNIETSFKRN